MLCGVRTHHTAHDAQAMLVLKRRCNVAFLMHMKRMHIAQTLLKRCCFMRSCNALVFAAPSHKAALPARGVAPLHASLPEVAYASTN